jgi:hypothetical protein
MLWKQEADRKANAFFDGVLPPFSNIGNTERGTINDLPTLRGIGQFALIFCCCGISTAQGLTVAPCPKCLRSVHSTVSSGLLLLALRRSSSGLLHGQPHLRLRHCQVRQGSGLSHPTTRSDILPILSPRPINPLSASVRALTLLKTTRSVHPTSLLPRQRRSAFCSLLAPSPFLPRGTVARTAACVLLPLLPLLKPSG